MRSAAFHASPSRTSTVFARNPFSRAMSSACVTDTAPSHATNAMSLPSTRRSSGSCFSSTSPRGTISRSETFQVDAPSIARPFLFSSFSGSRPWNSASRRAVSLPSFLSWTSFSRCMRNSRNARRTACVWSARARPGLATAIFTPDAGRNVMSSIVKPKGFTTRPCPPIAHRLPCWTLIASTPWRRQSSK